MNITLQRKLDQQVGPLLCRLLSGLSWWRREKVVSVKPERILVILLSEMGSLVLAHPMFVHLTHKYPDAELYALVFQPNKEVLDLLQVVPPANILTLRTTSLGTFLRDSVLALRTLRRWRIDTVLDCELFSRLSSILALLSGASRRVGFHPHRQEGLYRGNFINRPVLYNPYHHIAQQFVTLAEAIEATDMPLVKQPVSHAKLHIPSMAVSQAELTAFVARLKGDFPQVAGKRLVLIHASGGLLPIRAWPVAHFCQVAADLIGHGHMVGIIGLQRDKALAQTIHAQCGSQSCLDLTGYTRTIRELLVLFHVAALLITNDGGPAHFAALTPIPAIIFYGPETPVLYGSLDEKSVNFYNPLPCSPCLTAYNHRHSPCNGNNVCLTSIAPEAVLQRVYGMLETSRGFGLI